MDYKEKYEKALEWAKSIYPSTFGVDREDLEHFFPELKESEDERIRKTLIELVEDYKESSAYGGFGGLKWDKLIAWLEKQGEQPVPSREMILNVWELGNHWKDITRGVCNTEHGTQLDYIQKHWFDGEHCANIIEKQGEQVNCPQNLQVPNGGIVLEDFNGGEGNFKINLAYLNKKQVEEIEKIVNDWNKDTKNVKNCIGMILTDASEQRFKEYGLSLKECLEWLEKQGEKFQYWKPSEEQLDALDYAYNSCPDTERGNYYEGVLGTLIDDLYKLPEKQGEQKHTDKVEPKFKVGDWIVYKGDSYLIADIDYKQGRYFFEIGCLLNWEYIHNVDALYHLWTIQDAKDGDVLAEDSCIFIIKKLGGNNTAAKTYCTLHDDGDFDNGSILYFDIDSTKPATKEQRDILERAMTNAGYEWDAEKKELKKGGEE